MSCVVEWTQEGLFSVISYTAIVNPRKEFSEYFIGEIVQAKFMGKEYPARIIKKSGKFNISTIFLYTIISMCSSL